MAWKEISRTPMWKPEKVGDSIEGVYIKVEINQGTRKNSSIHSIRTEDGMVSFWGSMILDNRLAQVPVGAKVKIIYNGVAEKAKPGQNPAKLFKVFVDAEYKDEEESSANEESDTGEIDEEEIPYD